jgi:hypothetical protein
MEQTRWVWISIPDQGRLLAYTYVDRVAGPSAKGAIVEGPAAVSIHDAVNRPNRTVRDPVRFGAIPIFEADARKLGLPDEPPWLSIYTHGTVREPAAQPTRMLTGLVTRAGAPVVGADVEIGRMTPNGELMAVARCGTGADGRFAFMGAPEGELRVIAHHAGASSGYVELPDGGSAVLELLRFGVLEGTVERAGVRARAEVTLTSPDQSRPLRVVRADARGNFRCADVVPGRYSVEVEAIDSSNAMTNGTPTYDECVIGEGETVQRAYTLIAGVAVEVEITTVADDSEWAYIFLLTGTLSPTRYGDLRPLFRSKVLRSANSSSRRGALVTTRFLDVPPGPFTVCAVRNRTGVSTLDDALTRYAHITIGSEPQRVAIDLLR